MQCAMDPERLERAIVEDRSGPAALLGRGVGRNDLVGCRRSVAGDR